MKRAIILVLVVAFTVTAQESQLGRVEFPTSGSKEAQTHFLRGLAALHSFWYEEALDAFRESFGYEWFIHLGVPEGTHETSIF